MVVFENLDGLYLLAFLIPLIILYLIKAKPKDVIIPSLLFFSDEKKSKKYNSFLQKFLLRFLFFLQFLIMAFIGLSASNPIINIPVDAFSLNTVVVMDVSASMSASNRMDAGKTDLLKLVKGRSTIILAEDSPVIVANNVSSSRAKALISGLSPKDTSTRLDGALLLANELLGQTKGNVVVYSDFLLEKDDDLLAAKRILEASDKRVILVQTGKREKNVGFTSLSLNRGVGEALVKNFDEQNTIIDVILTSQSSQDTKRLEIPPYSVERISFEIDQGETNLRIKEKDALLSDNEISIMNPFEDKTSMLVITNKVNSPLIDALESNSQFEVEVTIPPVVPDLTHDVVIVNEVDRNLLLPNTFREIKKYKESGGKAIITAQEDSNSLDFQDLLGFSLNSLSAGSTEVCVETVHEITTRISSPNCFSTTSKYFDITTKNDSLILAATEGGSPIFILEDNLFYYGLIDNAADFKEQINYPLFWDDLIGTMLGKESISHFNFRTGDVYLKGNLSEKVILNNLGFQDISGTQIAVNLVDNEESDIFRSPSFNTTEVNATYERIPLEVNFHIILLIAALVLFFYELFYIKKRGDL